MGLITEESKPDKPGEIMGLGLGRATRREQIDEPPPPYSSEITLGMRSMLGIFFGLVLVCGVFFGLGYSVGRNGGLHTSLEEKASQALADLSLKKPSATEQNLTPAPAAAAQNTQAPTNPGQVNGGQSNNSTVTETDLGSNNPPDSGAPPKPAEAPAADSKTPVTTLPAASRPAPAQQIAQKASVAATSGQRPSPSPVTKPAASFSSPYAQPTPQPATQSNAPSGPGNYMVQIAAVRLPQDANILVGALQQHGFHAAVRHEGQDQLLHVQVGPFTTRAQAYDMRSKLLADGYNAVVK